MKKHKLNNATPGSESAAQPFSEIFLLLVIAMLLLGRNPMIFIYPEPWAEDMAVFLGDEYNTGFPATAFSIYAGYIHLLPRIIAWISLKAGLSGAMLVMNWSVLFFKVLTCFMIYKSREIGSILIKYAIIAYIVLMPFASEVYNNVTNLQWWLIPMMAVIIMKRETGAFSLLISVILLVLTGLTGVNSVIFAIPCACLMIKQRTPDTLCKNSVVIACALVQSYFLYTSGRSGTGKIIYEGSITDLISLFVSRVIFHTLFKSDTSAWISVTVFTVFISLVIFNIWHYRKIMAVRFVALFAACYTAVIMYNILKTEKDCCSFIDGFAGERYFVFLRLCTFALLVSSLSLLFKTPALRKNYKKLMTISVIVLCAVLLKRYAVSFPFCFDYYTDLDLLAEASPGETVKIHFPPADWSLDLTKK